jgi:SAM-dependent methyltransferase
VSIEDGTAEALPFEDSSFDTVLCTFTLCSVCTPAAALSEARRVLRPGGRFLFCEHGLAPDPGVARWQRRLEPVWKRIAGGCHLTRPVASAIEAAGFSIEGLETMYVPRTPRIAAWNEWGAARP